MLAHLLAIAVAGGSLSFYLALLLVPRIYRHPTDFGWSGLGLFYALVLWVCAGRLTGGVLLGQTASVALLIWLGWQTALLRQATDTVPPELPQALLNSPLGPFIQRFRSSAASTVEMPSTDASAPSSASEDATESPVSPSGDPKNVEVSAGQPTPPQVEVSAIDDSVTTPDPSGDAVAPTDSPDTPESLTEETPETQTAETDAAIPAREQTNNEHSDIATTQDMVGDKPPTQPPISKPSPGIPSPPIEVLPAVPPQDLSEVPEPAVITGLQDLDDLAALEPEPPEEKLEPIADIDPLAEELWGEAKTPSTPKKPEPSQPSKTMEQPKADPAPKASPSNTIEAEVSTSFADRIVEANFNPEEEDIVDVDVISSSPPQEKE